MNRSERAARRRRARRRREWAKSTQTDKTLTLHAHGSRFAIRDQDGKIAAHIRSGVPYEQPLLEHIYRAGYEGVAVDAGANIGNHTLWLAAMCRLNVVAFEPVKHADLSRNLDLNPHIAGKVTVHPVALGATTGTASHVSKGRLDPDSGTLPVRPLDAYGLDGVRIIKIDVEGMEPQVLQGAEVTIRRSRPVIFAEEWGQPEHADIAAVLEPWGYRMTRTFSSKGSPTPVGRWDPT